jgi:hypothetical protein
MIQVAQGHSWQVFASSSAWEPCREHKRAANANPRLRLSVFLVVDSLVSRRAGTSSAALPHI